MMQGSQMNAQQMKVYIAPDDHTDYMWSGDEVPCSKAYPARTFSLLSVSIRMSCYGLLSRPKKVSELVL